MNLQLGCNLADKHTCRGGVCGWEDGKESKGPLQAADQHACWWGQGRAGGGSECGRVMGSDGDRLVCGWAYELAKDS